MSHHTQLVPLAWMFFITVIYCKLCRCVCVCVCTCNVVYMNEKSSHTVILSNPRKSKHIELCECLTGGNGLSVFPGEGTNISVQSSDIF